MKQWIFASVKEAEDALLQHLGNPHVERLVVRQMTAGELADGLSEFAPAVVEILGDVKSAIAVPRAGVVLSSGGDAADVAWKQVRKAWEDPVRDRERSVFAKLPISKRAADKVIAERVSRAKVARVMHFATPPGDGFAAQLRSAGWWKCLTGASVAHGLATIAGLVAFFLIARAAFNGRWDEGWFWGWAILLAVQILLEATAGWWQGWLAIAFGGHLKQRLLAGSLEIDTDRIRHQGVGQLLSRVLESEALENTTLTGGAAAVLSAIELICAGVVLSLGSAAGPTLIAFVVWLVILVAVARRYAQARQRWVLSRNHLTHDLVEKMNGHRTRIAQQPPELWHAGEDRDLVDYLRISERMDGTHAWLMAMGPRGWLTLGMAVIGVQFGAGGALDSQALAISMGGVLMGYLALRKFVFGLSQFAGSWQAWSLVRELFDAAASKPGARSTVNEEVSSSSSKVMDVRDVVYAYPGRERQVLAGCSLQIHKGDRVLLEGTSGSGKSTFGAVLAGLRRPSGGLLLAGGLDPATTGVLGWRRRVATAPQYHENHVLAAPLLFNLLLGRTWPASRDDMRDAWNVCQELGLGPLLERMPGGMMEMVGDSGWQLSQGERSRVYLARAILQGAPLVILDESFAALDPETLEQCLTCVLKRAPSLLVIAHP
jgi:ATP-binding cassette subfamily B protein